ncbi:MAG: hypothetical protein C0433_10255 [Cyclobacterium sp.]|nr:hypothetical protein [Cyclobacterium sp.]
MREDWIDAQLGDVLYLKNGFAFKSSEYNSIGTPVIRISDINGGIVSPLKSVFVKESGEFDNYQVENGDILIAMSGATTGKFGVFEGKEKAYQNQRVGNLKPFSERLIHKNFIYYLLFSLKRQIEKEAYGGAQPNISGKLIERLKIQLPPLSEQRAIVSKIEELFSELDHSISNLKSAQAKLEIYRQAVLKKAFEGGLTEEWRERNPMKSSFISLSEISKMRKENKSGKRSIYHKKIDFDFNYSRSAEIPSWSKGTLDKLIYIAARIGWRGLKKDEYKEVGPFFLSVHSLNHGKYVDFSEAFHISNERYIESPEIQLQNGDVLLCKDGAGIGKIAIVKDLQFAATVNSSLLIIRGMEVLIQDFLYYLFSGPSLQKIVFERITGSATPHLFQNDIRKFELLIPPIEEQTQIVQEIESRLSVADKMAETIRTSLQKAEALRQSILKKAFEGKLLTESELEACRKEPDWEPAERLLERIKKEKVLTKNKRNV